MRRTAWLIRVIGTAPLLTSASKAFTNLVPLSTSWHIVTSTPAMTAIRIASWSVAAMW